jgi:hypothetical protein
MRNSKCYYGELQMKNLFGLVGMEDNIQMVDKRERERESGGDGR